MSAHDLVGAAPSSIQRRLLEEQGALSEAVLESVDVGVVACDEDGRLSVFNGVSRQFHGLDADASVDPDRLPERFSLYAPDGRALLAPEQVPLLRTLRGELVHEQEIVIAPHGLPRRLVSCTGRRVHGAGGQVIGAVVSMRDVTAQRAAETALKARAVLDPLTGLANRNLLVERTVRSLAGTAGEPRTTGLLFVDLDGFRTVNDLHGHAGGDQLLRQAAHRLRTMVRATDTAARLGGDEFVVMCSGMPLGDRRHATALAGRVVAELSRPFEVYGATVPLSASVGIAYADGNDTDVDELLARADAAMFSAKRSGQARFVTYEAGGTEVRDASRAVSRIERLLRRAISEDDILVHYQPVVDLGTGRMIGTEALARLVDEDGTIIPPGEFIQVAERSGLVSRLGDSVLRQALQQTARWKRQLPPGADFGCGVNLSVRQLYDPALVGSVQAALQDSGLAPDALVLELTESVFSDSDDHANALYALRQLGPRLSIDDFGTGYSSLSYLRRFTVDGLKIDRSFVADLVNARNRHVTHAIVRMALDIGVHVVAEGIETAEQLSVVRALGCRLGQGFLLARPGPPEAISAKLSDRFP